MSTRRERVILDLEDHFTPGIVKAAAGTALLNKELGSLSRDSVRTRRAVSDIDRPTESLGRSASSASKEVDKLSGRMRIWADVALILGPALIPIAAVGVPAVTALASGFGFAAVGAGTMVLAFQGVMDTLKALNAAALNPTTQNLEKAQVALEGLSPQAQAFVAQVGHMIPELKRLRDVAAAGMFPGLTTGITELETGLPKVANLVGAVSTELGSLAAEAGGELASTKWTSFLDFLAQEGPHALAGMAKGAGHTAHALAALWMATAPENRSFLDFLVQGAADLDKWATGLSQTQGFADFVAYLDSTGPKVADTLASIANAALQIVEAAAPLGGPVLDGVKALADLVSALANSDLGTPLFTAAAGLALFNRTMGITRAIGRTTFGGMIADELRASAGVRTLIGDFRALSRETQLSRIAAPMKGFTGPLTEAQAAGARLRQTLPSLAKTSALLAGISIASTGAADNIGLTNTASLALMGTLGGPWGVAVGGAVGLLLDAKSATNGFADSMNRANLALKSTDTSAIERAIADLERQKRDLQQHTGVGDFFSDRFKELRAAGLTSSAVDNIDSKIQKLKGHLEFTKAEAEQQLLADGFNATSDGIKSATSSTLDFQKSLEKLNAVLTGRASMRDFEQAIDDFTERQKKRAKVTNEIADEQAKYAASIARIDRELAAASGKKGSEGTIATLQAQRAQETRSHNQRMKDLKAEGDGLKNSLDIGTQAGRDTQAALDNIAATALKVAQGLDPIARTEFLAGARTEFVKAAKAAGYLDDQAQALADQVLGLSKVKGQPKIVIDATGAWMVIDETARKLERLTRPTRIINIQAQATSKIPQVLDAQAKADGGTVLGPRFPYRDSVLLSAAGGEEVITNRHGEADAFRADRAAGRIPAYADGGTVGRSASAGLGVRVGLSEDDVSRIVRGLATLRPLANHLTVQPHNYDEFLRQKEHIERQAGVGGPPL